MIATAPLLTFADNTSLCVVQALYCNIYKVLTGQTVWNLNDMHLTYSTKPVRTEIITCKILLSTARSLFQQSLAGTLQLV